MATRGSRPPLVLLMNDTLEERELYAHTLRAAGHRVIIPEDSGAAYQIATTRPPDVVVTDVRITGSISGLELARRLRSHQRTSTVRIIVLTSVSRPYDSDVALKAGADRCQARCSRLPLNGFCQDQCGRYHRAVLSLGKRVRLMHSIPAAYGRARPQAPRATVRAAPVPSSIENGGLCSHRMSRRKLLEENASDTCRVGFVRILTASTINSPANRVDAAGTG
jgi:CheY-like chemotaxis protein